MKSGNLYVLEPIGTLQAFNRTALPLMLQFVLEKIVHGPWFVLITNLTHFINVFISLLYVFRATKCSSSGESIVSVYHLVYIVVCVLSIVVYVLSMYS